ncbi:MAG: hypothetical protein IKE75_06255 [Bacilli bacterium]|nr:hypothetical protein [Bacilli bacterium]
MKYNTNFLNHGKYTYNYMINNSIEVAGERMGVLYFYNDTYVDLITGSVVSEENIIKLQSFSARDNELNLDSIRKIFEGLEDIYEYMATERQINNISDSIPSIITFKASQANHALEGMAKIEVPKQKKFMFRKK